MTRPLTTTQLASKAQAEFLPDGKIQFSPLALAVFRHHCAAQDRHGLEGLPIVVDHDADVLQIGGTKYAGALLRGFGIGGLVPGQVLEIVGRDGGVLTIKRHDSRPPSDERFDWGEFRQISELPEVDQAIRALLDDQTEDNSICMVRAIVEAAGERLAKLAAKATV